MPHPAAADPGPDTASGASALAACIDDGAQLLAQLQLVQVEVDLFVAGADRDSVAAVQDHLAKGKAQAAQLGETLDAQLREARELLAFSETDDAADAAEAVAAAAEALREAITVVNDDATLIALGNALQMYSHAQAEKARAADEAAVALLARVVKHHRPFRIASGEERNGVRHAPAPLRGYAEAPSVAPAVRPPLATSVPPATAAASQPSPAGTAGHSPARDQKNSNPQQASSADVGGAGEAAPPGQKSGELGYGGDKRLEPSWNIPFTQIRVERPHMVGTSFFGHVAYVCIGDLGEEGRYETVRRYTEFLTLRRAIVRKCPHMADWLPRLPDKALLGKFKPELWESRSQGLNSFMFTLLQRQSEYPILRRFLHRFFTL